jgi:hypothetical protein
MVFTSNAETANAVDWQIAQEIFGVIWAQNRLRIRLIHAAREFGEHFIRRDARAQRVPELIHTALTKTFANVRPSGE